MSKKKKFVMDVDEEIKIKYMNHAIEAFIDRSKSCETRNRSWEHCYNFFREVNKKGNYEENSEELSLRLSAYLASWGMYRGSSFVLQYDYKIFMKVIKVLFKKKYNKLWNLDEKLLKSDKEITDKEITDISKSIFKLGIEIDKSLLKYYRYTKTKSLFYKILHDNNTKINEKKILTSETLITKIIIGTIGCYPALDTYFIEGSQMHSRGWHKFNEANIKKMLDYIIKKRDSGELHEITNKKFLYDKNKKFPIMKLIDMAYFMIGSEREYLGFIEDEEKYKKLSDKLKNISEHSTMKEFNETDKSILKTIIVNTPNKKKSKDKGNFVFYKLSFPPYDDHKKNSEELIEQFIVSIENDNTLTKYLKQYMLRPIGKD